MALVVEKASLSGLKLLFRDAPDQSYGSGCIQRYDAEQDCFIVWCDRDSRQHAIQFKQFSVEQDGGQLVLKVPACTHKLLPAEILDAAADSSAGLAVHANDESCRTSRQASQQLSAVLSQQLSGLIGRCFSHTEEGFEVTGHEHQQHQPPEYLSQTSATGATVHPSTSAATAEAGEQHTQPQGLHVQVRRPSRHSTDSALDDSSYWGSPVKHDGSMSHGAAAPATAGAEASPLSSAAPASTGNTQPQQQQHQQCNAASSTPMPLTVAQDQPPECASTPPGAAAAAVLGLPGVQGPSFSSFQEISRMISHSEGSSPVARPSSIKTTMPPGLAARLLDEQGSWGTPQENSPWGTPREQQLGSNATNTPTSSNHDPLGPQHAHSHSGYAVHKLMFGGEQLHSRLEAVVTGQEQEQQQPTQQQSNSDAGAAAPADALGASQAPTAKPAATGLGEAASALEPAAVVAAAVAAVDAAAGTEADSFADLDFTIPVAMDVQPRPHSRSSSRIREMYRVGTASANAGMVVDVPQPLSSRHAGLLRSPGRSLPAPSDPGGHSTAASGFSHAASLSTGQLSASAGGAAGLSEQRRTATNIGAGFGSLGGSHAASRRMSRNASSRLNVDQDWALLGPEGQLLQQQLAAMQAPQQRASLGQVLHAPGIVSRRTSRTLSGRLMLDQDVATVLMEQLDDAEPDVLSRPLAPAAPGLDTIVSRRQSTSNGRGTPDSDGFGFSEFEGLEPLVPPEEAAAAALTEAAAAAAAAATEGALDDNLNTGALGGQLHHHRAHRRSARSLGVPPAANVSQRPSMRLSDQDPGHHGLAALPAMTAAAVAAAAAARAHASAAAGVPATRVISYDFVGGPTTSQPPPDAVAEAEASLDGNSGAAAADTPASAPTESNSRRDSRSNSTAPTATGSPRQSGTGSTTRSASGSLHDGRRSSRRSIPSIFQAAAAVAAAAEAAAAAAVGYALGGRDRTSSEQALDKAAGQAVPGEGGAAAAAQTAAEVQQDHGQPGLEQLQESAFASSSFLKQRLAGEGLGSVDSFTCPPFMPLAGSITVTGGGSGLSATNSKNSSAVSSSNGSQPRLPSASGSAAEPASSTLPLSEAAAAPAMEGIALPMAAHAAQDADLQNGAVYESSAAALSSLAATPGSPSTATAALLRKQQLVSSEGSEWGSGALLGAHLQLSTSGIDSPTGSAVFRLGGNSPHPLDACDSAGGSVSVAPGELSAALENLTVQSGCNTGGAKSSGIGASRMAREAAAAAAAGNAAMCGYSSGAAQGPVGAAALLIGTQVAAGLAKDLVPGLSEIAPAEDSEDDPGEDRIAAKYPTSNGNNNPAAGAVFFSLAGGCAPGEQTTTAAQQATGQVFMRRSSSGGGVIPAVSKVLGKVLSGKATLLTRPADHGSNTPSSNMVGFRRPDAATARSSDSSSSSHSDAAPPSYAESAGGQADDESSPRADPRTSCRVQQAPGAAGSAGAAAESAGAGAHSSVRQSAVLGRLQNAAASASQASDQGQQQQQSDDDDDDGSITPLQHSTGLVRRTPRASRAPSQTLPAGVRPSIDGLGLLGGPSFHYGDDEQPLMRSSASTSCKDPEGLLAARSQVGRVVLHTFLTLSAQWFDAIALVVLGPQLTGAMLPAGTPQLQQLQRLYGIFALGHVLSLLGCFLWPAKAAKLGNKGLLAWTLGLSGFCTALLGCMPSYAQGGMAGIGIITALRFCSGAAASNTAPAALAYLAERAPQNPSLHASVVPASMAAGAAAASGLALLLSLLMRPAVLAASGWRVVLVLSLLSNAVTGGLRGYVLQEPEGSMQPTELLDRGNAHVVRILRQYLPEVLLAVLLQAFAASGLFLLTAWLPAYFMQLAGMAPATALLINTVNMAVLAGSMPLGGLLADKLEECTPILLASCVTAVAFSYPAWLLFSLGVPEVTWLAQCILCVVVGIHWGALSEALLDLFPPRMRSSALTVAHTMPMLALGATAPLMAVGFISTVGSTAAPAVISIIMGVVTAATALWINFSRPAGGVQR